MADFETVCRSSDLAEGESRVFVVRDIHVALFNVQGKFFALRNECPHAGASLAHGYVEGDVVRCRIHHWGFCVRDGKYVDQDQPQFDASVIPVRTVGDEVQVAVEP